MRRLLNTGFGQLAGRARQLDLRLVMNDLCELVMEQVSASLSACWIWVLGWWFEAAAWVGRRIVLHGTADVAPSKRAPAVHRR